VNYPLGAFGRESAPEQPQAVLFQNATVWTCGEAGVLENASVLIGGGKILAVGRELEIPRGAVVIDAQGRHIAPGIIDCHSHMATDGGINEATQAITSEVRIGDFIDATDINIYRQLAGGVTSANILHGSANPIGGQNQVIKLRWGALPEQMKFAQAPAGIKFALGENVKQSNWGSEFTTRYPQSRMGVEQIIRDAFQRAKQYRQDQEAWQKDHRGTPPRTDLELEAIAEILEGKRWIHCHSYRQDEILALLRALEDFHIQIGTLQHILEGYKVADAMARHGAMGSSFSDWWAYKFEVFDAIPYNGALMHRASIIVSFNSDDAELARHLNQEAAKAVKYGGVPPEEALKFVTLNPARQLRVDEHVGSLEVGKDADLVMWNGPPLSNFSRPEQTWVDGRKYFDRAEDLEAREQADKMRAELIQKVLRSGESMRDADKPDDESQVLYRLHWPRKDIYCGCQQGR
jgi:N-acetylglucosamine-6-phosphate deacetylase